MPYSVALVMNSTSGKSSKINNLKIKIKDKENQNKIDRETAPITNSSSTKHKSKTVKLNIAIEKCQRSGRKKAKFSPENRKRLSGITEKGALLFCSVLYFVVYFLKSCWDESRSRRLRELAPGCYSNNPGVSSGNLLERL